MGPVRALNLWLSLSRCGDERRGSTSSRAGSTSSSPAQTDEALLDYMVSERMAEEAAGDNGIMRPIFEPGDALFFDELFLHKTGSDPSMPKPRYAIENWFFGGSGFPEEYAPIAGLAPRPGAPAACDDELEPDSGRRLDAAVARRPADALSGPRAGARSRSRSATSRRRSGSPSTASTRSRSASRNPLSRPAYRELHALRTSPSTSTGASSSGSSGATARARARC